MSNYSHQNPDSWDYMNPVKSKFPPPGHPVFQHVGFLRPEQLDIERSIAGIEDLFAELDDRLNAWDDDTPLDRDRANVALDNLRAALLLGERCNQKLQAVILRAGQPKLGAEL